MASEIKTKYSQQEILNQSFDETYKTLIFQPLDTPRATKVTTSGAITYVAFAPIGSSQSDPVWQARKIDSTTDTVITWADSGKYSQVATDLTVLTYT